MAGPIVVYGANGATGALIVRLAEAAGLRVIAAGRRSEAVAAACPSAEIRVGTLSPDDLDRVCAGAAAVVSCVAPYTRHGRPLVEAALRHGAHYVDCTGEPRYVAALLAEFDAPARAAGVALVPAAGIGLCTNAVARTAVARTGAPRRLIVDYRVRGMVPSPGTVSSTLRILAAGSAVARGGRLSFTPAGHLARLTGNGRGAGFPLTDVVTLHHQWPEAEIFSYIRSRAAPVIAPAMRAAAGLGRRPGFQRALDRAASGLQRTAPAARGQFDVTVAAEGVNGIVRAVGHVADIYEMTSRAAFHVTEILLRDAVSPGFRATGEVIGDPYLTAAAVGIGLDSEQLDDVGRTR